MSYTVNGVEYETWSAENQRILQHFVNREIYCNMSAEVEYMLSRTMYGDDNNPFAEEDNLALFCQVCSECGSTYGFEEKSPADLSDDEIENDADFDIDTLTSEVTYYCPICGLPYNSASEAKACCEEETLHVCQSCGKIYSHDDYLNLDSEAVEVYEWWAITDWLGDKLAAQGCVVISDIYGKSYWGRCTTGQSITLDGCIANIAKDMGILQGMENDWSARL